MAEAHVSWGEVEHPLVPRTFRYESLVLTLAPTPRYLVSRMRPYAELQRECLQLDEHLLATWRRGGLSEYDTRSIERLLLMIAERPPWAVVYESESGHKRGTWFAKGNDLPTLLARALAEDDDWASLAIVREVAP